MKSESCSVPAGWSTCESLVSADIPLDSGDIAAFDTVLLDSCGPSTGAVVQPHIMAIMEIENSASSNLFIAS
ncbi:MAG: hypothetical protein NXI32_12425 [bacterium]|nr:hypothetical protein [bacterium]